MYGTRFLKHVLHGLTQVLLLQITLIDLLLISLMTLSLMMSWMTWCSILKRSTRERTKAYLTGRRRQRVKRVTWMERSRCWGYFLAHTGDSSVGLGHLPLGRPTRFERRFLFSISPNLLFCWYKTNFNTRKILSTTLSLCHTLYKKHKPQS